MLLLLHQTDFSTCCWQQSVAGACHSPVQKCVCACRNVDKVEQHSDGWCSVQYNLPSHLPDFQHLTLRSIEVAAVTPAHHQPDPSASHVCLGYVGELHISNKVLAAADMLAVSRMGKENASV